MLFELWVECDKLNYLWTRKTLIVLDRVWCSDWFLLWFRSKSSDETEQCICPFFFDGSFDEINIYSQFESYHTAQITACYDSWLSFCWTILKFLISSYLTVIWSASSKFSLWLSLFSQYFITNSDFFLSALLCSALLCPAILLFLQFLILNAHEWLFCWWQHLKNGQLFRLRKKHRKKKNFNCLPSIDNVYVRNWNRLHREKNGQWQWMKWMPMKKSERKTKELISLLNYCLKQIDWLVQLHRTVWCVAALIPHSDDSSKAFVMTVLLRCFELSICFAFVNIQRATPLH